MVEAMKTKETVETMPVKMPLKRVETVIAPVSSPELPPDQTM